MYHTQQLDVASQDTMTQEGVTPLGDRGNVYHTQQLDVASKDTGTQQGVTVAPSGDRGTIYHIKQSDVASRDTVTQLGDTPVGAKGSPQSQKEATGKGRQLNKKRGLAIYPSRLEALGSEWHSSKLAKCLPS